LAHRPVPLEHPPARLYLEARVVRQLV
jgi:hypothetical protein